jgi:two-component system chemotaxis sensor kinase CheA
LRTSQAGDGPTASGRNHRQLIDRIFRHVHSVKGSAASCELEVVSQIAHEFENLLEEVRAGQVLVDDAVIDTCESATEALSQSLSLAASGIVEPSRRALFDRLKAVARNKTGKLNEPWDETEAVLKHVPFEIWQSLTEPEKQRLIDVVAHPHPASRRRYQL